jgi:uncharacterized protein
MPLMMQVIPLTTRERRQLPGDKVKKQVLVAALLSVVALAHAQSTTPVTQSAASASEGAVKISPAKKQLIDKILKLQQPSIELLARSTAEGPALQMGQQAGLMLRRLSPEQRETVGKGMKADLEKYLSETVPLVKERALALAPSSVGKILDEKFSEAELKQLVTLLESPIYRKFSEQSFVMQRALQEKLVADTRSTVEPKLKSLDQSWVKRLQDATPSATDKTVPPAPQAPGPTAK